MAENKKRTPLVDRTDGRECVINRIVTAGYFGSQHVVVLATNQMGIDTNGQPIETSAITARLRFDHDMAVMLRDALDQSIKALEPPADQKAN